MLLAHTPGARVVHPALLRAHLSAPGWRLAGPCACLRMHLLCVRGKGTASWGNAASAASVAQGGECICKQAKTPSAAHQSVPKHCTSNNLHSCLRATDGDDSGSELLLEACMEDILDEEPASVAQLAGLSLLALADGRCGTLRLAADSGDAGAGRFQACICAAWCAHL